MYTINYKGNVVVLNPRMCTAIKRICVGAAKDVTRNFWNLDFVIGITEEDGKIVILAGDTEGRYPKRKNILDFAEMCDYENRKKYAFYDEFCTFIEGLNTMTIYPTTIIVEFHHGEVVSIIVG